MIHAMIDLETLGTGKDGLILSMGAVAFNPLGDGFVGAPFKHNVAIQSALDGGATVQAETIRWWLEQSEEARVALMTPAPLPERLVLKMFREWYIEQRCEAAWGHGSNFDLR